MRQCTDCGHLIPEAAPALSRCPVCQSESLEDSYGYFPQRILAGSILSEGLEVVLMEHKEILPWDKIRMVFLGIVEEPGLQIPPTTYMHMKQAVSKIFTPEEKGKQEQRSHAHEKVYIEFFVVDHAKPFRMESTSLDYRGFLSEREYVSENNLKKLLSKLSEKLPDCKFDNSVLAYLANQKGSVSRFPNVYEFQRNCQAQWEKETGGIS